MSRFSDFKKEKHFVTFQFFNLSQFSDRKHLGIYFQTYPEKSVSALTD